MGPIPSDIESPLPEYIAKSTFNVNDDESLQWGTVESQLIRPKSRGSGIMAPNFITEREGYLRLTEEEYHAVKVKNTSSQRGAWQLLEYGESREG